MPPTVFIVDDDEAVRDSLRVLLEAAGHRAESFASGKEFLTAMPSMAEGCLIVDVRMPGIGGLAVQEQLRDEHVLLPVIVITGHGDVALAVRAMKAGAVDFVEKPFTKEQFSPRSSARSKSVDRDTRSGSKPRMPRCACPGSANARARSTPPHRWQAE